MPGVLGNLLANGDFEDVNSEPGVPDNWTMAVCDPNSDPSFCPASGSRLRDNAFFGRYKRTYSACRFGWLRNSPNVSELFEGHCDVACFANVGRSGASLVLKNMLQSRQLVKYEETQWDLVDKQGKLRIGRDSRVPIALLSYV